MTPIVNRIMDEMTKYEMRHIHLPQFVVMDADTYRQMCDDSVPQTLVTGFPNRVCGLQIVVAPGWNLLLVLGEAHREAGFV